MTDIDENAFEEDDEYSKAYEEHATSDSSESKAYDIESLSNALKNIKIAIPFEAMRQLVEGFRAIYASIEPIANAISGYQKIIGEAIRPAIEKLSRLYSDIDWEKVAEGSRSWGDFGWIPPKGLSINQVSNPPATLEEADRMALNALDNESLEVLFSDLSSVVPKRRDIEEAVLLFKGRHYKATAMMLCSLIECELIKADTQSNRRRPKNSIARLDEKLPSRGISLITAPALANAYAYFFHDAKNFDRSVEGELNRNFLQHGMMCKPVRKKTCIKLFLILQEVAHLTHL